MEYSILHYKNRPIRFVIIDSKPYVSLSDIKITRPNGVLIKQTLLPYQSGYIDVEIIEVKDAIVLIEDKQLADFISHV